MKTTWSSIIAAGLILATPVAFGEDPKTAPATKDAKDAKDAKIPALTVAASANGASPAAKEAVKDVAKGPGGAASASASAPAASTAGKTPKEVAKEVAAKADAVSKDVGNSVKEAAAVKDLAAKQAKAAEAKDAKEAKTTAGDAKDTKDAKDAPPKVAAAPKREPIKIDPAKEAQRQREYERARNFAHGITSTPKAATTDSRNTEAQLRTIIAAQQEELEYLRSIAHDVRVIKHSSAVSGYSYP